MQFKLPENAARSASNNKEGPVSTGARCHAGMSGVTWGQAECIGSTKEWEIAETGLPWRDPGSIYPGPWFDLPWHWRQCVERKQRQETVAQFTFTLSHLSPWYSFPLDLGLICFHAPTAEHTDTHEYMYAPPLASHPLSTYSHTHPKKQNKTKQ